MQPIVDGLGAQYADRVAFVRLDAENDGRESFLAYNLRGHPSFVMIDTDGNILWQAVGEQPGSRLEGVIRQALRGG
jgi:hypothetical protein